ncbi:MAG: TldD/PmbA family protein [Theionarchaea archaeon]|nr:TldD/PmbA family protein [Theionarchaea archaeon]
MKELCNTMVEDTQKLGATECETCIEDTTETIITIERGSIHGKRKKRNITFGLRTLLDKKKGFVAGTLPVQSLKDIEKTSLVIARNAAPDSNWKHLPYPKGVTPVKGIYDKKLAEITVEELIEGSAIMLDTADHPDITIDTGRVSCIVRTFFISNTHGISYEYRSTRLTVHFVVRSGESESTWGVHTSTVYDVDFAALAEDAVERAKIMSNPQPLPSSFTGDVIFLGEPVEDILLTPLKWCVNAQTIKRTAFQTKINERVASDLITVYDDGTRCGGIRSSPVDGEGNPTQKTDVITKGILSGLLHSEYTANVHNTISTGNAVRRAVTEPTVGVTNLILEGGKASIDELIADVKKGIMMGDFSGNIDPFSGLFNGVMEHSFYIEKGEITHPVTGVMIHGNVFDCLMEVENIGKEQYRGEGGICAVPILIRGLDIMI